VSNRITVARSDRFGLGCFANHCESEDDLPEMRFSLSSVSKAVEYFSDLEKWNMVTEYRAGTMSEETASVKGNFRAH
jgi:hypothetical protein